MGVAFERAQVLYQQERYAQAQQEFERDLAENPNQSNTVAMIAMCLTNQNQIAKARTTAEAAISLDPDNGYAHYSLAWAIYKDDAYVTRDGFHFATNEQTLRGQRFKLVENALLEALRLQPRHPSYHSLLAFTRLARRNPRGALASANACLEINPQHSDGHRAAAMALSRLGRGAQAQHASANAVTAQPLGSETHQTRGAMLLRHGDATQALPHFREALRLEPGSLAAQRGLLECLRMRWFFYRYRARLSYARWATIILYIASFLILDATLVAHYENAKTSGGWDPASLTLLMAGVALFCWLGFSKSLADLTLVRDPLGRRLLSRPRAWVAWIVASCTAGLAVVAIAIAILSALSASADEWLTFGGLFLGIAVIAKIFLHEWEHRYERKHGTLFPTFAAIGKIFSYQWKRRSRHH